MELNFAVLDWYEIANLTGADLADEATVRAKQRCGIKTPSRSDPLWLEWRLPPDKQDEYNCVAGEIFEWLKSARDLVRNSIASGNVEQWRALHFKKHIPPGLRFEVLERDGFRCCYCGATPRVTRLHVDHVYPFSKGGKTRMDNLATACWACNVGKGAREIDPAKLPLITGIIQ